MYSDAIKQGLGVANKNWQIVLIRLAFQILTIAGIVLFIVIPLVFLLKLLGYDLSEIVKHLNIREIPLLMLSRYLTMGIAFIILSLLYLLLVMTATLFLFSASCGMLAGGIKESQFSCTLSRFFREGRRLFCPFLGYSSLIGFTVIIELLFLAGYFSLAPFIVASAQKMGSNLGIFTGTFFRFFSGFLLFFLVTITLCIASYGFGILSLRGGGSLETLKGSLLFLVNRPSAFWFYCIMATGYILITVIAGLTGSLFIKSVDIGMILFFPYQIAAYALQRYLGLILFAGLFSYYGSSSGFTSERSIPQSGTYPQGP